MRTPGKNRSLGFEPDEETSEQPKTAMSEETLKAWIRGEVTPEQPERRCKDMPVLKDFGASPHAAHANSDASRREAKSGDRPVRTFSHDDGGASCHVSQHSQGHHQGNTLRSDTYLRQALTSPFNQRAERHWGIVSSSSSSSSPLDCRSGSSPSLWREGVGQAHSSPHRGDTAKGSLQEGYRQWTGELDAAHDQLVFFKTPLKSVTRAMFSSPDRARRERVVSGSSSPSSSASGSSGSGHHGSHHNPFEMAHDRLHFPVFSPNMFSTPQTPGSAEKETFQWNVEHLAELRPVHIDEKDIKRQLSKQWLDAEAEKRAQRAIDYYFQHHMVAPSPWSDAPPPHVLPVTPCGPSYEDLLATTPNQAQGSIQKDLPSRKKASEKSSQTTLTLPTGLDLEKLLGQYMTYQDTERDDSMGMSSSSLRRKLFFNADSSSVLSPVRSEQKSPDHLSAALSTPPNNKKTPEWERGSPIHTPSSVQFSSSPIRGQLNAEGGCFRSSFPDHGPLASPELSPIADRRRGRFRRSLGFTSLEGDMEDETDLGFGSPIRKQLQMEVHDGSSPRGRPSPDMSPIAAFGSGGSGQHSGSGTLRADMSHSFFPSPQHTSPHQHPHPPSSPSHDPASVFPPHPVAAARRISVSMDTDTVDFFPSVDKEPGVVSPRDSFMTELTLGEGGGSGLDADTLQHPSSVSYPDTGYQTGSGNGSLQTTQEGGQSMTTNTSTDVPTSSVTDTGTQLKTLASKLQSGMGGESGYGLRVSAEELRGGARLSPDESSVDGMGTSVDAGMVVHSNLTSQFMNLPLLNAELSADSTDLSLSVPAKRQTSDKMSSSKCGDVQGVGGEKATSRDLPVGHFSSQCQPLTIRSQKGSVSVDPPGFAPQGSGKKGAASPKGPPTSRKEGDWSEEDDQAAAYIYRHDADFLNRMGDYLEKGGELSDDGVDKGGRENVPPACITSAAGDKMSRGPDDSVLQRAHNYLASVNYPQALCKETSMDTEATPTAVDLIASSKAAGLSTPTKKLLGRVADDLTACRDKPGSPALASEVAEELIRRAEVDLKQVRHSRHKTNSS